MSTGVCSGKGGDYAPAWSKEQGKMICKKKSEISAQEAVQTFIRLREKLVTSNSSTRYQTQDHPAQDGPGNPNILQTFVSNYKTAAPLVLQKLQEEGVNLKEHPPMAPLKQRQASGPGESSTPSHPLATYWGNLKEEALKVQHMPGPRVTIEPPYVPEYINLKKQTEGRDQDRSTSDAAGPSGGKWLFIILLLLGGATVLLFLI
jgi:hypothetical protein